MSPERIIIIGAGPTGLGAAYKLKELGYENWAVYEKEEYIGGLSSSFKDEKGFTWDIGGHVMFSGDERFNSLVDHLIGRDFLSHKRESWIRLMGKWVPYPFQNNIRYLHGDAIVECLLGLLNAQNNDKIVSNFEEWICRTFGEGIARLFLLPYNSKVWAVPLSMMSYDWIGERVSLINIERIIRNVIMELDDTEWGPNSKFKFPLYGGTGGFFNKFTPYLKGKVHFNKRLAGVDIDTKTVVFSDGEEDKYDYLINTSPLDIFIRMVTTKRNDVSHMYEMADKLEHNGVYVVGIGIRKRIEGKKCWVYFPEEDIPFYRMTYFSNYSPNNVPNGDTNTYSSLMCEVSFSKYKPVKADEIVDLTVKGLVRGGILSDDDTGLIVSKWIKRVDYAYPIPTLKRDENLKRIQSFLGGNCIYSRGRFGAWKYEIGNMDHSTLMGMELIDRILLGKKEGIWKP